MIDLKTAAELIDFSTRIGSGPRAMEQLEGSVALYNILEQRNVAYLADEVGMGKTYVALGTLALFRHFNPAFRVLDLKSHYRGCRYASETIKLLPQKPDGILLAEIFEQIARLGMIHPVLEPAASP